MNKAYNPINWVNNETPINETNLNKMSNGLSAVDDRVIALNKTLGSYSDKINEALEASVVAQDAKEIALESAEKAEEALKNAEAVVGVGIATKDKAGLVKGGDVFIAEDGTIELTRITSDRELKNSHRGGLKVNSIIGAPTEQDSTTGKNMLNLEVGAVGADGTEVDNVYARRSQYISVINAIDYTFQKAYALNGSPYNGMVRMYNHKREFVGSMDGLTYSQTQNTVQFPANVQYIRFVQFGNESTDYGTLNMMMEEGDTASPYEPYTGGKAAPNPDYPMEIKKSVVGEIKTHGKNLFDYSKAVNGYITNDGEFAYHPYVIISDYIPSNGNVTVSVNKSITAIVINCFDSSNNFISKNIFENCSVATLDTVENCAYVRVAFTVDNFNIDITRLLTYEPMVNEGDMALPYEPYNVVTFSKPIELNGIGDVQDVIDVENGVVRKKIKKVVFDGSEDEGWMNDTIGGFVRFRISVNATPLKKRTKCLCDKAFFAPSGNAVNMCFIYDSSFYIAVEQTITTLGDFKNWLAGNPVTVIYELATEEVTDLPTADRIALNSLDTYNGITYLEFDSEIEPTFKGEYGTSKVGGYTLEGLLTGRNAELLQQSNADRITALETALINNV